MTTGAARRASPADALGSAFTILSRVGTTDIYHLPAVPIAGKRCRRQQRRLRVIGLRVKTRKHELSVVRLACRFLLSFSNSYIGAGRDLPRPFHYDLLRFTCLTS